MRSNLKLTETIICFLIQSLEKELKDIMKLNSLYAMQILIMNLFCTFNRSIMQKKSGMIFDIGEWVTDKAFSQIKKWNQTYSLNLKISINISPIQIEHVGFIDWFKEKLQKESIKPEWIDLEITESVAIKPDG